MGEILIGTSSWTDASLVKNSDFYPPDAISPEARLRHYSSCFPITQVDSTYYSPPAEKTAVLWATRTPVNFTFNIKAYGLFTHHPVRTRSLWKDVRQALPASMSQKQSIYMKDMPSELRKESWLRFGSALMPLHSAGKLGCVLMQFPPWFIYSSANLDYILSCAEQLNNYRMAVEFRHRSWVKGDRLEQTLRFLRDNKLPFVCVDAPQEQDSGLPPIAEATAGDLAMVRFHGRDAHAWTHGNTASERFKYLYSQTELAEWVPRLRTLARTARRTHVMMNNCYRDYSVRAARDMARLLEVQLP